MLGFFSIGGPAIFTSEGDVASFGADVAYRHLVRIYGHRCRLDAHGVGNAVDGEVGILHFEITGPGGWGFRRLLVRYGSVPSAIGDAVEQWDCAGNTAQIGDVHAAGGDLDFSTAAFARLVGGFDLGCFLVTDLNGVGTGDDGLVLQKKSRRGDLQRRGI